MAAYFAERDWRVYVQTLTALYRRRRDIMLEALAEHLPREADLDAPRRAACSSGPRCPTTSTPPTCSPGRCATTSPSCPARAAYLDGRGGSAMRLNFSGVDEDAIREGVRRIGKVVAEQVALYGTLTGTAPAAPSSRAAAAPPDTPAADPRGGRSPPAADDPAASGRIVPLRRRAG